MIGRWNLQTLLDLIHPSSQACLYQTVLLDECPSTNDYLLNLPAPPPSTFSLCVSESQYQGRGQHNKVWLSPPNTGIWASLATCIEPSKYHTTQLSILVGISLLEALVSLNCPVELKLKWPNDLYHLEKKIAGILIESATKGNQQHVVIGIGITLYPNKQLESLDHILPLSLSWPGLPSREQILAETISHLIKNISTLADQCLQLPQRFQPYDMLNQKKVLFKDLLDHEEVIGKAIGIDSIGRLIIEIAHKTYCKTSGHVSLIT